jgi:cytochrome c
MQFAKPLYVAALFGAVCITSHAAGDSGRGARLFRACAACHSVEPGDHMTGPSLAHAWNRRAGRAEGFNRYSDALKKSKLTWDAATLDRWLADPDALVPGTTMTFAGIKEGAARQDLIAYLESVSKGAATAQPEGGRPQGMQMRSERPNLRQAPPEGQVTSLSHCGDTYTVRTADGKAQKVWEFNLRFKTDSSKLGPEPGKPVVVGAGMQGDRASVIFSSPEEISAYVGASCK